MATVSSSARPAHRCVHPVGQNRLRADTEPHGCHHGQMAPEWLRLVVAMVCAVSALAVLRRRLAPASAGLLLACGILLVPSGAPETASAARFAASMVVTALAPLCGAVAALWWPVGPMTRGLVGLGGAALVAGWAAGILHAVAFDPAAQGCFECPRNLLAVGAASEHVASIDRTATALAAVAGLVVAAATAVRWYRSPPLARRTVWLIMWAGAGAAALGAAQSVHVLTLPLGLYDGWGRPIDTTQMVLLLLLATGVWWRLVTATTDGRPCRAPSTGGDAGPGWPDRLTDTRDRRPGCPGHLSSARRRSDRPRREAHHATRGPRGAAPHPRRGGLRRALVRSPPRCRGGPRSRSGGLIGARPGVRRRPGSPSRRDPGCRPGPPPGGRDRRCRA